MGKHFAEWALWWCQLFGYADCHSVSIFEAIILSGLAFVAGYVVLLIALNLIYIAFQVIGAWLRELS
jgi:hypothetical protein